MKIDQLIERMKLGFEALTGLSFEGLLGIIIGLLIFSLLIFLVRYEKKDNNNFNLKIDNLSEVGDPIEANINLARSLIEMGEIQKAKDCFNKVEKDKNLTQEQKERIITLKNRIKQKKNG